MDQLRRGYLYGTGAYLLWGFFPIYFKALRPAGPVEILAHRVVWSMIFVALLLTLLRGWRSIRELLRRPRTLAWISLAAVLLAINWAVYIYGVNSGHVVETSLGYFITPLISVMFGLIFFAERLRPWQWLAVSVGALAVAVIAIDYGRLPWIALALALSFGSYGLIKKRLGLPATHGLFLESAVLTLPAFGYLIWLTVHGDSTFTSISGWHTVLLLSAGALTAVPLLLFAGAANRVPLVGLGILQYLAPCLQLSTGLFIFHEPMPAAQLAGFVMVWLALVIFTWDALRTSARNRRTPAPTEVVGGPAVGDQVPVQAGT